MDAQFWITAWEEGRTGFHQSQYNDKLIAWFPKLSPLSGQKVLVPLCGKSKDMLWLRDQGLDVHGVELFEEAVKAFFTENHLPAPTIKKDLHYTNYSLDGLTISTGDFFQLEADSSYDLVYDRASLVALPESMRADYVKVLHKALKKNGGYLLLTYEYDQNLMQGPPFSISDEDVRRLYQEHFTIEKVETSAPPVENTRLSAVVSLRQNVYLLRKK